MQQDASWNASSATVKRTAPSLKGLKGKRPIVAVTAYDFALARLFDHGDVDVLLVGDTLGMVVQGRSNTLSVTLDQICYHTRLVAQGARYAHVVADLPFMTYQLSSRQALASAGKAVKRGMAEGVKLEGGARVVEQVRRIVDAGIPVMGHVGLTPQSVHAFGGFRVQGKGGDASRRLLDDARALDDAGVYAIVVEAVPSDIGKAITEAVSCPTIGIGAGPACDGQVLVCHDLLGMTPAPSPKFVKRYAEVGSAITAAISAYAADVTTRRFPDPDHCYAYRPTEDAP
jgi:3-methyl-2-oxobutanoate hydroxymethyltransferase